MAIAGSIVAFDDRYTHQEEFIQLAQRLDQKIGMDRMQDLQARMWRLEDRYGEQEAQSLDEYRCLKLEWDTLNRKLK